jgi:hypothetical protein
MLKSTKAEPCIKSNSELSLILLEHARLNIVQVCRCPIALGSVSELDRVDFRVFNDKLVPANHRTGESHFESVISEGPVYLRGARDVNRFNNAHSGHLEGWREPC